MGPYSSEPIAGSTFAYAPQVSFHLHFFQTILTHFLQVEDSFAPSNAFLDFEGMGPHSSEPIAGSSTFAYTPQVSFHFHFLFQMALTHNFLQGVSFQGMGLPASNNLMSVDEWKVRASGLLPCACLFSPVFLLGLRKAFI